MKKSNNSEKTEVLIVGGGSVGLCLGNYLKINNINSAFLLRKGLSEVEGSFVGWGKEVAFSFPKISRADLNQIKIVFFAVKAFDLRQAIESVLPMLSSDCVMVPLSNGAYGDDIKDLPKNYPTFSWRIGVCEFGVCVNNKGQVDLTSEGSVLRWGPIDDSTAQMAIESTILANNSNHFLEWDLETIHKQKIKWLFNTVMNSICAYKRLPKNKFIMEDLKLLDAVFEETFTLFVKFWPDETIEKLELKQKLLRFIDLTSENENSMARDIRLGRRTETDYLAGLGDEASCPILAEIHQTIKGFHPQ